MPPLDRSIIAQAPAFLGLPGEELDRILAVAQSFHCRKDAEIFSQGREAEAFYLLLSGHVRVVRTSPEGHQLIARYINEGELFGIAVAIGRATYPASAVAAVDCVVLSWPNRVWPDFLQRYPAFGAAAYRTVGDRLQETQARVMALSTQQVEQRVAHSMLRLARQAGRKTDAGIEIDFPISRQDIADMTGTTLHTVSRLLSAWENDGVVRSGRRKVTVTDPHRLMLIAENRR